MNNLYLESNQMVPYRSFVQKNVSTQPYAYEGKLYQYRCHQVLPNSCCHRVKQVAKIIAICLVIIVTLGLYLCWKNNQKNLSALWTELRLNGRLQPVYQRYRIDIDKNSLSAFFQNRKAQQKSINSNMRNPVRTVSAEDRVIVDGRHVNQIKEACQRAKEQLSKQGKDLGVMLTDFGSLQQRGKLMFDAVQELFVELASNHWTLRNNGYGSLLSEVTSILTRDCEKEHLSILKEFMQVCLQEMNDSSRACIADNVAEFLLCDKNNNFPEPKSWSGYGGQQDITLVRLICPYTQHTSLQQLFAAVFLNDVEKLKKCLNDSRINPFIETVACGYDKKIFTIFDIALLENNVECLKVLLERCQLPVQPNKSYFESVRSFETARLLLDYKPAIPMSKCILETCAYYYRTADNEHLAAGEEIIKEVISRAPEIVMPLPDRSGFTYLETLFYSAEKSARHEKLFEIIFQAFKGDKGTRIFDEMQQRILLNKETKWLKFLPEKRRIACETFLKEGSQSILARLSKLTQSLKKELVIHNHNLEMIDSQHIFDAYELKKEIQQLSTEDREKIKELYPEFLSVFNQLIERHPIFGSVRLIAKKINQKSQYSEEDRILINKFLELYLESIPADQKLIQAYWKQNSLLVRKKICDAHKEVSKLPIRQRWIQIMHGTKSTALPIILQTGKLMASGALFEEYGTRPLSGEGTGTGETGINRKGISTLRPDSSWEQYQKDALPGVKKSTNFLLAEGYSTLAYQVINVGTRSLEFKLEKAYEEFDKACERIFNGEKLDVDVGLNANQYYSSKVILFWRDLERTILRLKTVDNTEFMKRTKDTLEKFKALKYQIDSTERTKGIKRCLTAWQSTPKLTVDPSDIFIKNVYPVLFASSTYTFEGEDKATVEHQDNGETVINRALELGEDIDLAFTSQEGMEPISKALIDRKVTVLTTNAGRYLQMRQMIFGSRPKCNKSMKENEWMVQVTKDFQFGIAPFYATPYPSNPTYVRNGERLSLRGHYGREFSDYNDYKEAVDKGNVSPRSYHYLSHTSRTMMWAELLRNIYAEKGLLITVPPYALTCAAGAHDAGRQDDGEDRWEEESAALSRHHLRDQLQETNIQVLDILSRSISYTNLSRSAVENAPLENLIVGDADRLDIVRCISNPKKNFRINDMYLKQKLGQKLGDSFFVALLEEVITFVEITENTQLRKYLDQHSQNYFRDMVLIFNALQEKEKKFPIIAKYLKSMCEAIAASATLDPKITELLRNK